MQCGDLARADDVERQPNDPRFGAMEAVFVHAIGDRCEAKAAGAVKAGVLTGLGLELLVERDAFLMDTAEVEAGVVVRRVARRVPGRSSGELIALDQDDVGPA